MAQFGKLISFIGSKRLVFRKNFSHSARDKIARATGGAGHRGNGRPDWSNLRVDVEGDDFVECTVCYIQCDLCNCIIFVCLFRYCSFGVPGTKDKVGCFCWVFERRLTRWGLALRGHRCNADWIRRLLPEALGEVGLLEETQSFCCATCDCGRGITRGLRWIHESLGEKSPSEKGNEIQRSNRNRLHLGRLVSWPRKQAHSNDKYSELIFSWQSCLKRVIRLLMRE